MRTFKVIVTSVKEPFYYPPFEGEKALKLMESLKERGHTAIAHTAANGIDEELTLEEIRELFN